MSIIAKDGGTDFERPADGMHQAVCINVIDVGNQAGFQGKIAHKIVILWEIDQKMTKGDRAGLRFIVSKRYTLSLNEKAHLRNDLRSWRGRDFTPEQLCSFDVETVIGANCLVNVQNETNDAGKKYTNVVAITPLIAGQAKMTAETEGRYVPDWVRALMHPDGSESVAGADQFDDSVIPF